MTLEAVIISDSGNVLDALVVASRAALWDLRIPRTKGLDYQPAQSAAEEMEVDAAGKDAFKSAIIGPRQAKSTVDFELEDYWDGGVPLQGREALPVCITLNLVSKLAFISLIQCANACTPAPPNTILRRHP
jgi:exosome complex component RRP42